MQANIVAELEMRLVEVALTTKRILNSLLELLNLLTKQQRSFNHRCLNLRRNYLSVTVLHLTNDVLSKLLFHSSFGKNEAPTSRRSRVRIPLKFF